LDFAPDTLGRLPSRSHIWPDLVAAAVWLRLHSAGISGIQPVSESIRGRLALLTDW